MLEWVDYTHMMKIDERHFTNGSVYALSMLDNFPVEVTDTFLPIDTKYCINGTNILSSASAGSRDERWMIGVSCMSGCPVGCKFCATGKLSKWRKLASSEIISQINYILSLNSDIYPYETKEFKINYTRMGEPFLNIEAVKETIQYVNDYVFSRTHHYISTIGIRGSDFSWIKDNITLQISLHSLDEKRRHELIPFGNALMSIEELGQIRTNSNQKTALNLTLVDESDFDMDLLKKYFDPDFFFIKISPVNINDVSIANNMGSGVVSDSLNLI